MLTLGNMAAPLLSAQDPAMNRRVHLQTLAQHLRDESAYMKDFLAKVKIDFST